MARPSQDVTEAELAVLQVLWDQGPATIRQITDLVYEQGGASQYATVQKLLERLEAKGAVKRIRMSGNFHMFQPAITRETAQGSVIDELLAILGGQSRPVVARLIETGKMTMEDVEFAEKTLREARKGGKRR